jgi:hypothetical protein
VKQLADGGNQTVLGLVDWDGNQQQTSRIRVLCHNVRNGLENLILDPVLVVAALAHHSAETARALGLIDENETFSALSSRSAESWQNSVKQLATHVLGPDDPGQHLVVVSYVNGMALNIRGLWLTLDDHKLEKKILDTFAPLKNPARTHHSLNAYVTNVILSEHRGLAPNDLVETFRGLLTVELQ